MKFNKLLVLALLEKIQDMINDTSEFHIMTKNLT
jgi:hypothetical protein